MRKKKGFAMHQVCEQNIIVGEGRENIDFNNLITMNSSAAFLWNKAAEGEFTVDGLVEMLCKEYDVDKETARRDCEELVSEWLNAGIIEE